MWNPIEEAQQIEKEENKRILNRLDQLQLSKWHIFMAIALGLVWVFDGYQVTIISLYRYQITQEMSQFTFKQLVTAYQIGGIVGSITFGVSAFIIGRKNIFIITLFIYFIGVLLSGVQTGQSLFIFSRFLTGVSVGGQFTAIFTAVDQFLPPRYRGRVNIAIDGTWHLGGALAALLTMLVGETEHWRLMFLLGLVGVISLVLLRKNVPESPRWLIINNRIPEAQLIVLAIESAVQKDDFLLQQIMEQEGSDAKEGNTPTLTGYICEIGRLLKECISQHPKKCIVSLCLIVCQAFFFNQVYYEYPNILGSKFGMSQSNISRYMLPLSVINFLSTLAIGPFFDKIGRRALILLTYLSSSVFLLISYEIDTFLWRELIVIILFIFASPASSSANLIASEIFPTSSRTLVMFVMFILSMLGGMAGIWVNNHIVSAILMAFAAVVAFLLCPNSQNKTLQQIQKM